MTVDKEKNIVVAGIFSGTLDFDFSSNKIELTSWLDGNGGEGFIAKYDSLLNYKWVFSLGKGYDVIGNILTDDSGNIYVQGNADGSIDFDPSTNVVHIPPVKNRYGEEIGFIAKYNKNGDFKWGKRSSYGLIKTFKNSIYGNSSDSIIKYDSEGNELWTKNVKGHKSPVFDENSKFYFITDTANYYYQRPLSISTIDTLGNFKFFKKLTQSSDSKFSFGKLHLVNKKLIISAEYWGSVYMDPDNWAGYIYNTTTYELFQRGQYTGIYVPEFRNFIAEYDLDGNFIMVKDNTPNPYIFRTDNSGNIFTVGVFFKSINLNMKSEADKTLTSIGSASYIAEYDSSFNFISAVKLAEVEGNQILYDPGITNLLFNKNYTIIAGAFNNLYLKQDVTVDQPYPESYIAIYKNFKLPGMDTGIIDTKDSLIIEPTDSLLSIYPNPIYDRFTVEIPPLTKEITLAIYNNNGQEIFRQQLTANKTQVDISHFINGIYFVKLITDKTIKVRKIIKE